MAQSGGAVPHECRAACGPAPPSLCPSSAQAPGMQLHLASWTSQRPRTHGAGQLQPLDVCDAPHARRCRGARDVGGPQLSLLIQVVHSKDTRGKERSHAHRDCAAGRGRPGKQGRAPARANLRATCAGKPWLPPGLWPQDAADGCMPAAQHGGADGVQRCLMTQSPEAQLRMCVLRQGEAVQGCHVRPKPLHASPAPSCLPEEGPGRRG